MPETRPVVAAFDLDGTLTEGGSVVKWLSHVAGATTTYRAMATHLPSLAYGALMSGTAADTAKESLFRRTLQGRTLKEVTEASREFAHHHVAKELRPAVRARLDEHLALGHRVVLVSASPELYVGVIAELLGAHGFLGTRLAVDPLGRLTGGYLGNNCRGEEKLRRLTEWVDHLSVGDNKPELYAYGNSRGDRRMLSAADHPVDCGQLGTLGALRAFPRLG